MKNRSSHAGHDSHQQMRFLLEKNKDLPKLNRQQLRQLQEQRLRDILTYAKNHSVWHGKRLQPFDLKSFTLSDLSQLPTMSKRDLMANWDSIVTDKHLKIDEAEPYLKAEMDYDLFHGYHLYASGGSSGRRGLFVWDPEEIATFLEGLFRYQYRDEYHSGNSFYETIRIASVAATKPVHLSEVLYASPIVAHSESIALSATDPLNQLVKTLNEYQPTHLNGYPSIISRLAGRAIQGHLNIQPRRILVGSEPLRPYMVNLIKNAWPRVILNNQWGSTDAGIHAVSCDQSDGKLHLIEDLTIIEPVDENNQLVSLWNPSVKVLVTSLHHKSLPVFRYELDDRVIFVDKQCACGSRFQLIESIEGRHEDDFVYGDIIVMAEQFENVIMLGSGIDEYQVSQTKNGADIALVIEPGASINIKKCNLI